MEPGMQRKRFTIQIGPIDPQELDLLECLVSIDEGTRLNALADDLLERLIDSGLVNRAKRGALSLTSAGIDRCSSLRLRAASDAEAAKILADRGIELARLMTISPNTH